MALLDSHRRRQQRYPLFDGAGEAERRFQPGCSAAGAHVRIRQSVRQNPEAPLVDAHPVPGAAGSFRERNGRPDPVSQPAGSPETAARGGVSISFSRVRAGAGGPAGVKGGG